jgi:hypothetical protein
VNADVFNLLGAAHEALRLRHFSARDERAYVDWMRRYLAWHGQRHPRELGAIAVTAFLSSLDDPAAASGRAQALAALAFLYGEVLGCDVACGP